MQDREACIHSHWDKQPEQGTSSGVQGNVTMVLRHTVGPLPSAQRKACNPPAHSPSHLGGMNREVGTRKYHIAQG